MIASSIAQQGMFKAVQRFEAAATPIVNPSASEDIVSDFVEILDARQAFDANAKVLKTADAMLGRVLDIKA